MGFMVSKVIDSDQNQKLMVKFIVLCGVDPTPLDGHMGDPMYAGFDPLFW